MSYLVHVDAKIICPHFGSISSSTSNNRVFVNNRPIVTQTDSFKITRCSNGNNPCTKAIWTIAAKRVFVNGNPVIMQSSSGLCLPTNGPPKVMQTQERVSGK